MRSSSRDAEAPARVPAARRGAARRRRAAGGDGRGDARSGPAARRRRDRGGADRACRPLSSPAGGSTSSGSAAPGSPPTPTSPGPGAPRCAGWEARETIFLETLPGVDVDLGGEPRPPDGWEVVVSAAHTHRAPKAGRGPTSSPSSSALRRAIVVGGAHGKTTTAAMIAWALRETGPRPGLDRRRRRAAARRQRRERDRAARRRGRRVRPLDSSRFVPRSPSSRTSSSTTTPPTPRRRSWRTASSSWLADSAARRAHVGARARRLPARGARRAQPAKRRCGAGGARAGRRPRRRGRTRPGAFTGVGRRFELVGERGGVSVYDDYGHNPTELAATLRTAREQTRTDGLIAVYQPHVYERTRQLGVRARAGARARRHGGRHGRARRARRAPRRRQRASASSTRYLHDVRAGWARSLEDAATIALTWARPGRHRDHVRRRRALAGGTR